MKKVTDSKLLDQLNENKKVTDPKLLKQLNAKPETSSWGGRFATGVRDPILGASQLVQNSMPDSWQQGIGKFDQWLNEKTGGFLGNKSGDINQEIQNRESLYQAQLPKDEGFDEARMFGNVLTTALATKGMAAPQSALGAVGQGVAVGGGMSAVAPVSGDDYWKEKAWDVGGGAVLGGALGPAGYALGKVVSPAFKNKEIVNQLKAGGVNPTVGQTLGGAANKMEQKLTSIPFMGDAISNARFGAQKEFNNSMINKALEPIGKKVKGYGVDAVDKMHRLASNAYKEANDSVAGLILDKNTISKLNKTWSMSQRGMSKDNFRRFEGFMKDNVINRFERNGGITSSGFKKVDAVLFEKINKLKNSMEQQELRDALKQVKLLIRKNAEKNYPEYAKKIAKADKTWARTKAIESASGASALQGGQFTPGQMVSGIKKADLSKGKSTTARGNMPMQDYAVKSQDVLGNTVPNSGTIDRMLAGGGLIGAGILEPTWTMVGLGAGSTLYTKPMQNLLNILATQRPKAAKPTAEVISKSAPFFAAPFMMGY